MAQSGKKGGRANKSKKVGREASEEEMKTFLKVAMMEKKKQKTNLLGYSILSHLSWLINVFTVKSVNDCFT